jgi:predicted nucleic acid-binding Zn ribbon protein
MPASNPERDRRLAARARYRYRAANALGDEIESLLGSETFRRLKRFQKVTDALKAAVGEQLLPKLKPTRIQAGVLTIEVIDGPLLAELRQHRERAVLQALAQAGTGVTEVQWRIARSRPSHRPGTRPPTK